MGRGWLCRFRKGGFGASLVQLAVAQEDSGSPLWRCEGLYWPRRVGRGGPRLCVLAPQELPNCSPDVHEVLIHAPGCLGRHRHRDPVLLQGEGRNAQLGCGASQPLRPAQDPGGSAPKAQRHNPTGRGNASDRAPQQLPPDGHIGDTVPQPHAALPGGERLPQPRHEQKEHQGIL